MKLGKYNCPTSNNITITAVEFKRFVVQKHVFRLDHFHLLECNRMQKFWKQAD